MKVILTGASGFIGNEVLTLALSKPSISTVVVLSRRALPASPLLSSPKLRVVIVEDFAVYTPAVLKELEGADACIWTIGAKSTNAEVTRKVSVDYTLALANALASLTPKKPIRFVFLSGVLAVSNPKQSTWFYGETRRTGGEAETKVLKFAKENEWKGFILKPAGVRSKEGAGAKIMGLLPGWSVSVEELAETIVDLAVNDDEGEKSVWENSEIVAKGRKLLGIKPSIAEI